MKKLQKVVCFAVAAAMAAGMLTGCVSSAGSTAASSTAAQQAASSEQQTAGVLKQIKLTAHGEMDTTFIIGYDEQGRVQSMGAYAGAETAPEDATRDYTLHVDYTDGAANVAYNEELVAAYTDPQYMEYPEIYEVKTFESGAIQYVNASCDGAAMRFEFSEDGLLLYCSLGQEMGDYALSYTQGEDGRYVFAGAEDEYPGHFDEAEAGSDAQRGWDAATFDGEVTYQ